MATDPVMGSEFFEREEILSWLTKRLDAFKQGYRQNMALLGAMGVGKSSVLHQFLSQNTDPNFIPIFVEVPQGSLDLFIKRFMGACLTGLLKSKGEELPWDVTELIQRAKKFVPKTVRHMRSALKLANLGREDEAYREVLAIPRIMREEALTRAVLVLDSFGNLETLSVRDPFGSLGKEIMIDKDTMYLVASSHPLRARQIFREKLNLLFGNFEILEIKNFDFAAASRVIQKKLGAYQISRIQENFLIHMTDAHPFYLAILLSRIESLSKLKAENAISPETIFQAFQDEVESRNGRIHQYLNSICSVCVRLKIFVNPLEVLAAIAQGHRKISEIARFAGLKIADAQKVLQKLLEEEIVQKEGAIFLIPDILLRFWLKYVAAVGYLGFESNPVRRQEYFRRELEAQYKIYEEAASKDLPKRVEELFRVFSGEVVSMGTYKVLCPSFHDIHSKPTNGRVFPVFARASKGAWLCQIASKPVKEDDIRVFQEDVKKQGAKVTQKVVVALSGIDLNATLAAKDSKIAVWDLKNFNRLLEIYDRPKVIL